MEKPDLATANQFLAELDHDTADLNFLRLEREAFTSCPSVALDVAVMERTGIVNVLQEKLISDDARNCYLRSEHQLVVMETDNAATAPG